MKTSLALVLGGLAAFASLASGAPLGVAVAPSTAPTLALVGGMVVDGYGGPPIHDGVVLISGDKIVAVGPKSEVPIPKGVTTISTAGMTVLPGLMDMHVHLMIVGHADYRHWDTTYMPRFRDDVMPAAAKQLLLSGITTVRDLGARLEDILPVRDRIARGEIPGPRVFASGPFLQRAPYEEYEKEFRWGINGAEDARAKTQKLIDAGVDFIKLIDQDQLTDDEVEAIVATAHKAGKKVIAHAHREDEIRMGLKHGVDDFEHTGLATEPGYPEDILAGLRRRNATLFWCPTIEGLFLADYTARVFPERLDDPEWQRDLPADMAKDIRASFGSVTGLDYFALTFRRLPTLANKFRQLRETGVTLLVGTDSGIPGNFHTDSTWRELVKFVELGMSPLETISAATRWPARFLGLEHKLGTLEKGAFADVIAVRGDALTDIGLLKEVDVVVKGGKRYK
jgi:imidazolonepropionase-like amidohydrolase